MHFELSSVIAQLYAPSSSAMLRQHSPQSILENVFDAVTTKDATYVCYAHAPPVGAYDFRRPRLIASRGLSESWTREYVENRYSDIDPISRAALSVAFPFSLKNVTRIIKVTKGEQRYLRRLEEQKLFSGLCVPVFGPRGRNGFFGIGFDEMTLKEDIKSVIEIQNFCQQAHLIYCELIQSQTPNEQNLSDREKDVLRLVLEGHSNKEISNQLGVSANSVATYLSRAQAKLGTDHRFSSATRALTLGMLD